MIAEQKRTTLARVLALWLGSLAMIGILLFFYAGVGLYPILAGGTLTLAITLIRYYSKGNRSL